MTVATSRAIRVFVSSTFRDMAAEREELVKFVFPQLRKLCEQRGVTWGEVDLRWGITDEQTAEGKVLPICLAEIERSRPYFIGLLGERYGWVPEEIPQELIDEEPWLKEHLHHSVTELEILHGVLRNPDMEQHAFFYLRDPAYVETLPEEKREDSRETDEGRAGKLAALKERIRTSFFPVREDYPDSRALGQLVLEDLTALIEHLYPVGSEPDALQREAAEHEAFAASRAGVYIGRREYFERLDAHADGEGPPLVVLGASGGGKSALLAKWALERREAHPDELLLMHFVGASPGSSEWAGMLRRIMGELMKHFAIEIVVPDSPEELRPAFANLLHMAAANGRVVLIIDALDQLDDRQGARELLWLPPLVPANVRLVLSTLPGASLDELTKRGWPTLTVEPLRPEERTRLITEYLAQYRKELGGKHSGRIATAPQSANPLFLRALLEELRLWGQHETLDERIAHYLAATGPEELYALILERYEADYERERPNLVREAMSLMWAARRGLSESELLDLLGENGRPLLRALWSPLYQAAEASLVDRAGLLNFSHEYLRTAVQEEYIPEEVGQKAAHMRLAQYFDSQDLSSRKADELPWQLAEVKEWWLLCRALADPRLIGAVWANEEHEAKHYWSCLEGNSFKMIDAYAGILANPSECESDEAVWGLADLLSNAGYLSEELDLLRYLSGVYEKALPSKPARHNVGVLLNRQALNLQHQGLVAEAASFSRECIALYEQEEDSDGLQVALGTHAMILRDISDLPGARQCLVKKERICRDHGLTAGLAAALIDHGLLEVDIGNLSQAMSLFEQAESLCGQRNDRMGLSVIHDNKAQILFLQGNFAEALAHLSLSEEFLDTIGNIYGLQMVLGHKAIILGAQGNTSGALEALERKGQICREHGYVQDLVHSLANQAEVYAKRGRMLKALPLAKEANDIANEHCLRNLQPKIAAIIEEIRSQIN